MVLRKFAIKIWKLSLKFFFIKYNILEKNFKVAFSVLLYAKMQKFGFA